MIHRLDAALVRLDSLSKAASRGLHRLGVYVALPTLLGLVTLDVLLRYLFNAPLSWGRDANGLLLLVTLFSCLPHAWDRGYHIRMEIFYARMSSRTRRIANALTGFAGAVFFGAMGIQALGFVPYMIATEETPEDLLIPLAPFMAFMGFASLVFAARLLSNPGAGTDRDGDRNSDRDHDRDRDWDEDREEPWL